MGRCGPGMAKYASRFISCRPRVTLSSINPQVNESKEQIISEADKIAVGKRGTAPVSINSIVIGIESATAINAMMIDAIPKKAKGRSDTYSLLMVIAIRQPSL